MTPWSDHICTSTKRFWSKRQSFWIIWSQDLTLYPQMMPSSNGNIFCVTGHLRGEFTGHRWIPRTKASDADLWCFLWSTSEKCNSEASDLRHHRTHYDVIVTSTKRLWSPRKSLFITMTSWWARWRLKSPASRSFAQPFVQAQIKRKHQSTAPLVF